MFEILSAELLENRWVRYALHAVDIGIVYYLCYRILLLIRGTRAFQMLMGLFLIVGAFIASQILGLATLNWLIGNFLSYSFIFVLVVLFQHDIRRGLQRLGGSSLLSGTDADSTGEMIEEVVKGVAALAARRLGALIVIERAADLEDYVRQGSALDAAVSRELLIALFHHASPLHDGATVLRGGRVAAAGIFLPLTTSGELPKNFGTRHRAAVGLSEEVDAPIVVVSEERGTVSLVLEGKFEEGLDQTTLRRRLSELIEAPSRRGGGKKTTRRAVEVKR